MHSGRLRLGEADNRAPIDTRRALRRASPNSAPLSSASIHSVVTLGSSQVGSITPPTLSSLASQPPKSRAYRPESSRFFVHCKTIVTLEALDRQAPAPAPAPAPCLRGNERGRKRAYAATLTRVPMIRFMLSIILLDTGSTYPKASAVWRHASVSRADPSAVRYLTVRTRPNEPLPSAMLSTTLLAARLSCLARSASRLSMAPSAPRIDRMTSSMSS